MRTPLRNQRNLSLVPVAQPLWLAHTTALHLVDAVDSATAQFDPTGHVAALADGTSMSEDPASTTATAALRNANFTIIPPILIGHGGPMES